MAQSDIQVTVGSGTRLRTATKSIGGNTRHEQYHHLGEPDEPTYVATPNSSATMVTSLSHMGQLMAGSSLAVYVRRIVIWQNGLAGAATIVNCQIRRLTTAGTGGTAYTVNPWDSTDAAAGATAMTLPTSKGTEGPIQTDFTVGVLAAAPTVPMPEGVCVFDWNADRLRTKAIRIPAGTSNGLCVKNLASLASATFLISFYFTEASY